jgi:hypothetical protein
MSYVMRNGVRSQESDTGDKGDIGDICGISVGAAETLQAYLSCDDEQEVGGGNGQGILHLGEGPVLRGRR